MKVLCRSCSRDLSGDLQSIVYGFCSGACAKEAGMTRMDEMMLSQAVARIEQSDRWLTASDLVLLRSMIPSIVANTIVNNSQAGPDIKEMCRKLYSEENNAVSNEVPNVK